MKDGEEEKRWVLCPWCKADHALRPFLNKCTPHSRYFSDELGVQFF